MLSNSSNEPIAIVGMGCRFPGQLHSPDRFWRFLKAGETNVTDIPEERFPLDQIYEQQERQPGKTHTRWGAYFDKALLEGFDNSFFGMSPREAERLDPQQRILLETAWESVEDAGIPADSLNGSDTGVYVGAWVNDFEAQLFEHFDSLDIYSVTGSGRYAASGRIAYILGLQGPTLTVDTACSSSLVAVHLACNAIWNNECSLALAGGVNIILQPHISVAFSQAGIMAPDGRCKFGDASANGYVRSEGGAMIVLKPLDQARADGDRIYATILGSAVNNDGQTGKHFVSPGLEGQKALLGCAWQRAGVGAADVSYVEAHGTGTSAGDWVELNALGAMLAPARELSDKCLVGSVKSNLGHLESAAGIAGLIKAALTLHHKTIPPSLHLKTLNPNVSWQDTPLEIVTELMELPSKDGKSHVGVTSFGISGTNSHVILGSAPNVIQAPAVANTATFLVPLSGHNPAALQQSARSLREHAVMDVADLAYMRSRRRTHLPFRAVVMADERASLAKGLEAIASGHEVSNVFGGRIIHEEQRHLVWVLGEDEVIWPESSFISFLETYPEAARMYQVAQAHFAELNSLTGYPRVMRFCQQLAWIAALKSWGVGPQLVVGVGQGRYLAAYIAGMVSLEQACQALVENSEGFLSANGHRPRHADGLIPVLLAPNLGALPELFAAIDKPATQWLSIASKHRWLSRLANGLSSSIQIVAAAEGESAPTLFLQQLARLYSLGFDLEWPYQGKFVTLPNYPWQRRRLWFNEVGARYRLPPSKSESEDSIYFGEQLPEVAHRQNEQVWQKQWLSEQFRLLIADQSELGQRIVELVATLLPGRPLACHDLVITIPELFSDKITTQLVLSINQAQEAYFQLFYQANGVSGWRRIANGQVRPEIRYHAPVPIVAQFKQLKSHRRHNWLLQRVCQQILIATGRKPTESINTDAAFALTKRSADELRERLQSLTDLTLPGDFVFQNSTPNALTEALTSQIMLATEEVKLASENAPEKIVLDEVADLLAEMLDELED